MLSFLEFLFEASKKDILDLYKGKKESFLIKLKKLKYRHKIFEFDVKGKSGNDYQIQLKLDDYKIISRMKDSTNSKLSVILDENIHVHCTCPSFLY